MECLKRAITCVVSLAIVISVPLKGSAQESKAQSPPWTQHAWILEAALNQLSLHPQDPYLQYVALQLASREGTLEPIADRVASLAGLNRQRFAQRARVDLFSIFTGALAVHESLQLDTMTGDIRRREKLFENGAAPKKAPGKLAPGGGKNKRTTVPIAELSGPTIKSHPWKEMLKGREPKVSQLSLMVPADQYYVQCRSLTSLLGLMDFGNLWAAHLFNQSQRDATSSTIGQRLRKQLAVRTNPLARPFYDAVVGQVAITGSDLFVREGSDVTLLFQLKQPAVFKAQMDKYLAEAAEKNRDAKRTTGKYRGVEYTHVATPDRRVHVFSAYPLPGLHVRSNSQVALRRVLSAIKGGEYQGRPLARLGDTEEFKYIRTLMPEEAPEEDVFVYMSDPFIRHMVSPRLKLTERRRMLAYNYLRMISHGALLHQTQFGQRAESLKELANHGCTPGVFGQGKLEHPLGGEFSLAADGLTGRCSVVGRPFQLTPCCEIELEEVSSEEAQDYERFLREYNSYWRTFFDPIAVRVQMTPKQYRVETIVLPLIDNSIYTGLAATLGGKPEPLDGLPVPKGNIFSVAARLDKRQLFAWAELDELLQDAPGEKPARNWDPTTDASANTLRQLALAMHIFHDAHNRLPSAGSFDRAGKKPLLSWRVHVLPYLEQQALYQQFRLDEPWDSEHNKKLITKMPAIYRSSNLKLAKEGKTTFVVPVANKTLFPPKNTKGLSFRDVADGLSNTIMLVEADDKQAVIWTKPDDLSHDANKPLAGLRMREPGAFLVALGDGSVQFLRKTTDAQTVAAMFTRAGGEVVDVRPNDRIALRLDRRGRSDWRQELRRELGLPPDHPVPDLPRFVAKGIGNQLGFHLYDAEQLFDFNFSQFLGQAFGSFGGRGLDDEVLWISMLVASLNSPVYVSVPWNDAKIDDAFLDELDPLLGRLARKNFRGWFWEELFDFYRLDKTKAGTKVRAFGLQFGPLKWRFFWARIGNGLYLASKKYVLDDLEAAASSAQQRDPGAPSHAMVRIRPENWNKVLPDFQLGWAENNRRAVFNNLGPLSSVARAYFSAHPEAARDPHNRGRAVADIMQLAERVYGVKFLLPDGGRYILAEDGKSMVHSLYGSPLAPRQSAQLNRQGQSARLLREFAGATAELKFLEDGLHGVLTLQRR